MMNTGTLATDGQAICPDNGKLLDNCHSEACPDLAEWRSEESNIKQDMAQFKNNGKLKLLIIVGTRPEIIRLAAVINKCREYFDCLLAHTGQNYDYNLNGVFFKDLKLADPDVYMEAVGGDLGETMGNIIAKSYQLMVEVQPDAVLVLGDTNSCLSVIGAKRLHKLFFKSARFSN